MSHSIVTCASFGASGSGIVTDYLKEYPCIKSLGDYEFRFIQDYDGISTLEDALVHTPHRLNSDIAVQNYMRYIDRQCGSFLNRRYEKFFKGEWRNISIEFLQKLIELEWPGYWEQYQIISPTKIHAFLKYQLYPRFMKLVHGNKKYIAHYLPRREMFFSAPTEIFFLQCVKEYIEALCNVVDPDNKYKYLFMDQLLPPANIARYERYFYSIKTIVVDRDPRDYYIENVLRWGEGWVPKDINKFAVLYRKHREQAFQFTDSENVLRLRFEEAIFDYPGFEKKIQEFLGLSPEDHYYPLKYFNPAKSINNTCIWEKREVDISKIREIERYLSEYLYDFRGTDSNNKS